MRVAEEPCDLCRLKYASAVEVVDELRVALEAAELISRAAQHEYDEAWKAVRILAGQKAWEEHLKRSEPAAVCTTAASQVIVGIGWFAKHIVRHRLRLSRHDDHDLSANQPIGKVPLSSPPTSSTGACASTPPPDEPEPCRRMIAGVVVPPRPPALDKECWEQGCQS
jgi:hypothetical protein